MSAAGRCTDRIPHDAYTTPPWPVHRLLEAVKLPGGLWVESCAGDGSIIRAVNQVRSDVEWMAIELRGETKGPLQELVHPSRLWIGCDLLSDVHLPQDLRRQLGFEDVRVCISNPPYSLAEEIIRRQLEIFPNAIVVDLLRLNFYAGAGDDELKRAKRDWMAQWRPGVRVLPNRPSFRISAKGSSSDSCDYGWYTWRHPEVDHTIDVLDVTDLAVRKPKR